MPMYFLLCLSMIVMAIPACNASPPDTGRKDTVRILEDSRLAKVRTGADQTIQYFPLMMGKRVGVTGNQTSMIGSVHLVDSLLSAGIRIVKVFCPEHGFRGEAEAGAKVNSGIDHLTGLPVVSLYGDRKKPAAEDLKDIEVMVFDIQDVGARFYTYISTLHYVMEACAEQNIPVLVLDRPNPNGHYVDGPVLKPAFKSFIGMHPVPLVHGMTMAEYAQMINEEGWLAKGIRCNLSWIRMAHYSHQTIYRLPVNPSPNLQDMDAIYLYPSLCLLEGTVASVGRGTDLPFRLIGHPEVKSGDTAFTPRVIPGKSETPKFQGVTCYGWKLNGQKPDGSPMADSLDLTPLLKMFAEVGGNHTFFTSSFNKLAGTDELKQQIISGLSHSLIRQSWQPDLQKFRQIRAKYLLYPE